MNINPKHFFIPFICVLLLASAGFAQTGKKMTVRDYLLAIPTEYIKAAPGKRAAWIESESTEDGWLAYDIPLAELTDATGDGRVFGTLQVFEKSAGGVVVGMANNLCADGECLGMLRFLDYSGGQWNDVTEELMPSIDNDLVIEVLKTAPAYKKPLKDGEQVPLAIEFNGTHKAIHYLAGCAKTCDGGVVAAQYKWNGEGFAAFDYEESPE